MRGDLLEDAEDIVSNGGVEEEENDDEGGSEAIEGFWPVPSIEEAPEDEANRAQEQRKKQIRQKVNECSPDE